jgi:TRAP transporter TAXI family solute receptor
VAQATQGSVENLRQLNKAQIESAFAQADLAAMAYAGSQAFASGGPMPDLRAIASLFPEALHVIVRVDSPIRELADLAGKPVSLGEEGSGSAINARALLAAAGFAEGDVVGRYLRLGQAAAELKTGGVDAVIVAGGLPIPAITELAQSTPIRLIPIGDAVVGRLQQQFGYYRRAVIPAGAYRSVDTDTRTIGFNALWLTRADADAELIYEITRAAWSPGAARLFAALGPIGRQIRLENALDGVSLPLHPGAERFYRESGMRIDRLPVADTPGQRTR